MSSLQNHLTNQTPAMLDLLAQLVSIESPTHNKQAVDLVGAAIADQLRSIGASITRYPQVNTGDHILGVLNMGAGNAVTMVMHMDTVHPIGFLKEHPAHVEAGKYYGPGSCDMKASHVIALSAVKALQQLGQLPKREIRILFTSDEETGSHTSRELIEEIAAGSALCMVMEPPLPDGRLKSARKGTAGFKVVARGRAAHAGVQHENGINAIVELAHQMIKIQSLTDYSRGLTLSIGNVSGGGATNVVPDYAVCNVDCRIAKQSDAEFVVNAIKSLKPVLPGAMLEIDVDLNRPPFEYNAERQQIIDRINSIAQNELGRTFTHGSTGGGSDASFTATVAPTMDGFGAVGDGMHALHEHVVISSLAERASLTAAILRDY
jgi:glutamate carboxypeptidase